MRCFNCSVALSLTIQGRHAREFTRLVPLVRFKSSSNHPPPFFKIPVLSGSGYVESSRVRMYVFLSNSKGNLALRLYQPSSSYAHMCFSVGKYVLWFLVSALSGVVAYQLYVDPTQMLCMFLLSFYVSLTLKEYPRLVLPFFKPVRTYHWQFLSQSFFFVLASQSQDMGPCFPMSKPHSAHLLGEPLAIKCTLLWSLTL
jgi:hypothetical protein